MSAGAARPGSAARGWGHALPERAVDNAELERTLETSDEWIVRRTGIRSRRVAGPSETTSALAARAARMACARAGWAPSEPDLVIVATATPDRTFPSTACLVQAALGCRGAAFDLAAACSGFVYGLSVADAMLRAGPWRRCVLAGAETFSRIVDWGDRGTAVLFGDGAGAVALEALGPGAEPGLLAARLAADGSFAGLLETSGGPGSTGDSGRVRMDGREVYRHGAARMAEAIAETLEAAGLGVSDVDWFVPHQANLRLLETMAERAGIPRERMLTGVERHANTSAASIPLVVSEEAEAGRFRPGDLLLLEALGAGFTWGGALLRWDAPAP